MDWFVDFDSNDQRTNGLEFVEGLWADKLAAVAILATIGIIVACIVWCLKGGDLQTVFTVMGFVLTLVAGKLLKTLDAVTEVNVGQPKLRWQRCITRSLYPALDLEMSE